MCLEFSCNFCSRLLGVVISGLLDLYKPTWCPVLLVFKGCLEVEPIGY
uniref:Uncharacterized protein n=1 Tax=Anguilla anguilla TaxID=7936 RepID=A0A0E9WUZ6_ANGAN